MLARAKWVAIFLAAALGLTAPALSASSRVLPGHVPTAAALSQPIGRLDGARRLNLAIGLPLRDQPALDALLQELYDPASPNYRHYLTADQFAARFGATENDYQAVIAFAQSAGLKVTRKHANRLLLDVSGPAAQIEKAFRLNLHLYNHPREARTFYAPDVEPSVDGALPILHVSGLDNFQLPRPASLKLSHEEDNHARKDGGPEPSPGGPAPQIGSGPAGSYIGNDFRAAYVPGVSLNGYGQQVGLVEFDGYVSNDIAAYTTAAGQPSVTLTNVLLGGFGGGAGSSANEVSLDIEMTIAMAPSLSRVIVYEAATDGPADDLLNTMATDNLAKQLSSSWTFGSDAMTTQIFQQFAAQGQSYFNASGDSDAYSGPIFAPADSAYATIVGGTALVTSSAGGPWTSEAVWNIKNSTGSGGGVSTTVPIPSWQQGINMSSSMGSTNWRNIPDVACAAQNVWVIFGGGNTHVVSGTSCSTPLWAGFTALVNQQAVANGSRTVGFLNPALYQIGISSNYTRAFHDIVAGNNTNSNSPNLYFAVTGYDLCTGWGTPNGQALIDALAPPDTLEVLPVVGFTSSGPIGGPFGVTGQDFELTNGSAAPVSWSAGTTASWLAASSPSGSLNPGAVTNLAIFLAPPAAALSTGSYTATASITNFGSGLVHARTVILNIYDPLVIAPQTGFAASGQAGGPFNIGAENFVLTNGGPAALSWAVITNPPWVNVSPQTGTLPAGQGSATVQVSLNSTASNLAAGSYSGTLVFSNLTTGTAQTQPATLAVGQPPVVNGGFETGTFSGWSLSGNGASVVISTDPRCVHSGKYGVQLGPPYSLGYLSQTVPTLPGRTYLISLWLDSPDGLPPNQFQVSWNGYILFNQTNLPALGWTNIQVLAAATGPTTVLQFGYRDDQSFLGLDDISATPVTQPNPPAFQSVARLGTNIVFNWSAIPGASYQLQSKGDLNSPQWTNAGPAVTAASSTAAGTNAITNSQQFFRLLRINAQ